MQHTIQPLPLPQPEHMDTIYPLLRECLEGTTPPLLPLPSEPAAAARLTQHLAGQPAPGAALIMATSGTTGVPKGARLSVAALHASINSTHAALGGTGRWLLAVPAHHIIGMQVLLRSLYSGYDPITIPLSTGFHLTDLPTAIDDLCAAPQKGTPRYYASLVPSQLDTLHAALHSSQQVVRREAEAALSACARLDAILSGGAPLADHIHRDLTAAGLHIVRGYGSSEVAGGMLFDGRPGPATTIRIDPQTHRLSIGGATLADGYVGMEDHPDWSEENGERWYHTHDLAHWDEEGRAIIDGRLDEAINSGGIMVVPQPLEAALRAHPGVADCAIIGLPDPHFGQQVTAVVVPHCTDNNSSASTSSSSHTVPAAPTLAEVHQLLSPNCGRHSLPKELVILPQLPHRSNGKLNRRQLQYLVRHMRQR